MDFAWSVWAGTFDDFEKFCKHDLQNPNRAFASHNFLNDNTDASCHTYRAFVATFTRYILWRATFA